MTEALSNPALVAALHDTTEALAELLEPTPDGQVAVYNTAGHPIAFDVGGPITLRPGRVANVAEAYAVPRGPGLPSAVSSLSGEAVKVLDERTRLSRLFERLRAAQDLVATELEQQRIARTKGA